MKKESWTLLYTVLTKATTILVSKCERRHPSVETVLSKILLKGALLQKKECKYTKRAKTKL